MIDIHTHIGKILYGKKTLTSTKLIRFMDKQGIEKAVVLPIENPEETHWYSTTFEVIKSCKRYPDRLIPFCNIDPRRGKNSEEEDLFLCLIEEYVEKGCKGFGEILANLKVNDLRLKNIYQCCAKFKIPVLLHFQSSTIGVYDEVGFPYLEEVLKEFPDTIFIAHGPGFWAEISKNVTIEDKNSYPAGSIETPGKIDYLLEKYSNLYADISAGSGYNALIRDQEYSKKFLEKHSHQILFGTDYLFYKQEIPIIEFIKNLGLTKESFELITYQNARRILNI